MAVHMRLGEALEAYLRHRETTCARTTVKNEAIVLRRFAAWYGDVQLRHLRPDRVEQWFTGPNGVRRPHVTAGNVHRTAVSASTANYYRKTIAGFFKWAMQRGHLRADPLIHVPPLRATRRTRLLLTPDELVRLVELALDPRDRVLIAILINTGLRAGSALSLTVGDVDFSSLSLSVKITKSHLEDVMPITADLEPELRRWLRAYAIDLGRPLRLRTTYSRPRGGRFTPGPASPTARPSATAPLRCGWPVAR